MNLRKTQEKVVHILDEDLKGKYIFPKDGSSALARVQSAIIGNNIAFIKAHESADRRSPSHLVNARRIREVDEVYAAVPEDIIAQYAQLDDPDVQYMVRDYFETE